MSAKRVSEIREAISSNDVSAARKLISVALKNEPDADIYYLASLVALDDNQKSNFLNKALELDPFHEEANNLLEGNQSSSKVQEVKKNPNTPRTDNIQISKEAHKLPNSSFWGDNSSWLGRIRIGAAIGLVFSLITLTIDGYWLISTVLFLTFVGGLAGFISPPVKKFNVLTGSILMLVMIFYTAIYVLKQPTYIRYGMIIPGLWRGGVYGSLIGSVISRITYWINLSKKSKQEDKNA